MLRFNVGVHRAADAANVLTDNAVSSSERCRRLIDIRAAYIPTPHLLHRTSSSKLVGGGVHAEVITLSGERW